MVSQKLLEIEYSIRSLSLEEQQWLLERIKRQIQAKTQTFNKFTDTNSLKQEIEAMAGDPDIQVEVRAINQEFAVTEMDGLSNL